MSGRYSPPDGIGVPYYVPVSDTESDLHIQVGDRFYGFVRESRLFDGRCEYTPLAPVGGYYEPVDDTQYPTLPEALAALSDHLGDEDMKHRLKGGVGMTDTKCYICGHALEEHAPYVVWHTGWDGCEECDRDYERGVSLCPVCIDALAYMGMTLGGNTYLPDLPFGEVENWAYDTLWHAVWMPDDMTVGEAECARDYLDREGLKDLDPAWDSLPLRWWDTPEEFKASEYAEPFLRRFGLDEGDLDRLAKACLEHGDVLDDWHTVTDARKVGERLRKSWDT